MSYPMPRHTANQFHRRRLSVLTLLFASVVGCAVYKDASVGDGTALPGSNGGNQDTAGASTDLAGADSTLGGRAAAGSNTATGGSAGSGSSAGASGSGAAMGGTGGKPSSAGAPGGGASSTGGGGVSSTGGGGASSTGGSTAGSAGAGGAAATVHELAKGRVASSSTQQTGYPPGLANDGDATTRWCAAGYHYPETWQVDLAALHTLKQLAIQFEFPDRTYSYYIETSPDNLTFTKQAPISKMAAIHLVDMPAGVTARYVKITMTGVSTKDWACIKEFEVTGS